MKKQILMAVMTVALATIPVTSALAQMGTRLVADVPFDFHVGSKNLKAGVYTIHSTAISNQVLRISNAERGGGYMFQSNGVTNREPRAASRLIFNRYGDQYFLTTVFSSETSQGWELNKSAAEREAMAGNSTILAKTIVARK